MRLFLFFLMLPSVIFSQKIDRKNVVNRHSVLLTKIDTLNSLTVGNGHFAMTVDVTGLQTFPNEYKNGIPLGTQSEWGWHSFPSSKKYDISQTLENLSSHGRQVPYAKQWAAGTPEAEAANYIRQNQHRIHLAQIGLKILKKDGSEFKIEDLKNIDQKLDLWSGEIVSKFEVEGIPVELKTLANQQKDLVAVSINSDLLKLGRIGLKINFAYPSNQFLDEGTNFDENEGKRLSISKSNSFHSTIQRKLDNLTYFTHFNAETKIKSTIKTAYGYEIEPENSSNKWNFCIEFSKQNEPKIADNHFEIEQKKNSKAWASFWTSGGFIDFGNTTDKRAEELERRMVLSMYLTKINCGGNSPPQETGLTYNSWYGKPHMEMIWWHALHFALWGKPQILEKQLSWYFRAYDKAKIIAKRQGFSGARWQKMTDNDGQETGSSVGSYLIWQQPHLIYLAEVLYQNNPNEKTLKKYNHLIESTADFMADFAFYDPKLKKYILGPGVIAAQERFDPKTTFNPSFELSYWEFALETAQKWQQRIGKNRNKNWDKVLNNLSVLPIKNSLYLGAESALDSYENEHLLTDHPSVLGAYGMLPPFKGFSKKIMENTYQKIETVWHWNDTWGWDFPMVAMTAARLGNPEKAVDALLMPVRTNTYLKNGHNYQDKRLRLYLPGNGGLLIALAMMAAGTQEDPKENLGFPAHWKVKNEGLWRMP